MQDIHAVDTVATGVASINESVPPQSTGLAPGAGWFARNYRGILHRPPGGRAYESERMFAKKPEATMIAARRKPAG
jgi:hypothetical protein